MKKSELKLLLITLMIASLILTSCQPKAAAGDKPIETAVALQMVKTGTQGVEIELQQNSLPNLIYDKNELIVILEVKNKGNHDLAAQDCFIQITGFDPTIITGGFNSPRSCAENAGVLEGKNVYNVQGSTNILEFESTINLPLGVQDYNPTLNFLSCYNYHTSANPAVCVDPLFYQVTPEQKTCIPKTVTMGGGQGGPVGVSYVDVDMVGKKAVFEINVRNVGTGRVLSPYTDIQNCGQTSNVEYSDLDKVAYNVEMSGGRRVSCKPVDGMVRLNNGQGKIICSFDIPGASAYETPLLIDLDYSYIQSYKRPIKIIQTPQ